jgi:FkbM family methyltransferase
MDTDPLPDRLLRSEPIVLLDVGARGGLDPRWRPLASRLRVVGFEPDRAEFERLDRQNDGVRYLPYAVGEHDNEPAVFHVTHNPQCSSVLEPDWNFIRPFAYAPALRVEREVPITLTSLATICHEEHLQPDALKLDAQGLELAILRGAGSVLATVLIVESEVEFNPQYQDQPLFGDVDRELRKHGFFLLGMRRTAWRRAGGLTSGSSAGGTLMHGDGLWVRDAAALSTPRQLMAMCLLLSAYHQHDLIAALLSEPHPLAADWSEEERRKLLQSLTATPPVRNIRERVASWVMRPIVRAGHHRHVRGWIDRLRAPGATDWHDPDFY